MKKQKYVDTDKPEVFFDINNQEPNYEGYRKPADSIENCLERIPSAVDGNTNAAFVDDFILHSTRATPTEHQEEVNNEKTEEFNEKTEEFNEKEEEFNEKEEEKCNDKVEEEKGKSLTEVTMHLSK